MASFRPFTPSPAYRLFLTQLIETRENRGFSQEQLGEYLGLTRAQIQAFESGEHPLGFIDVRNWLLALDMPFVEFTTQMEEVLDSALTHDETIQMIDTMNDSTQPPADIAPATTPESQLATFETWPAYLQFLDRLREARLAVGLSLEQMADHLDIDLPIALGIEAGTLPVDFAIIRKWCHVFNLPGATFADFLALYHEEMERIESERKRENDSEAVRAHSSLPTPTIPTPTIQVLFFAPDAYPVVRTIQSTLEAKQELVEGLITTFDTGIEGTIGVANDEALVHDMDPNRLIPATGAHIFGPFFVAGDAPPGFRSLTPRELELALDHLAPEVPQRAFTALMRELEGGREWMENWE